MITCLVFDFGRVISASKPASLFHAYEKDLGLEPHSINRVMFDSVHWYRALTGEIDMSTYWQTIGSSLNLDSPQAVKQFQERYYQDEEINTEVKQLIHELSRTHNLAVLSNHPSGLQEWLVDWQLDGLFDVIICSADVGVVKPDKRIFELLLERMEVPPEQIVFIDDTTEHVLASHALGMHGVVFTTAAQLKKDLRELGCYSIQSPF